MNYIYTRWSRAGYLPAWFYALLATGFVALAIFAAFQGAWLATAFAILMVGVTMAAARYMPRLARAAQQSQARYYPDRETKS